MRTSALWRDQHLLVRHTGKEGKIKDYRTAVGGYRNKNNRLQDEKPDIFTYSIIGKYLVPKLALKLDFFMAC